jgi:CheY-like chemotaxis protein
MNNLTVLVAEEDEGQTELLTNALSRNRSVSHTLSFQNGQDVLTFLFGLSDYKIPGEKYVLILDAQMPQVSGLEVLKIVKNHETLKSMPVIIFSSVKDTQTMELCYRLGCNAFIQKPIDCTEFDRLSMLDFLSVMQVPDTPRDSLIKSAS